MTSMEEPLSVTCGVPKQLPIGSLFAAMVALCLCSAGLPGLGCASIREGVVKLAATPPEVRATIEAEAAGRKIEKINHLPFQQGPIFRAYIRSNPGPQLLTLDAQGKILDNAVAVPFASLPPAVQEASRTAVTGKLQLCRKSLHYPKTTYVLDYLLGEDELVFALIEEDGFVRSVIGYAVEDPD